MYFITCNENLRSSHRYCYRLKSAAVLGHVIWQAVMNTRTYDPKAQAVYSFGLRARVLERTSILRNIDKY